MIVLLLTFAVPGSVFAAQSLVAAAQSGNGALGTAMSVATSIARTALGFGGVSAAPKMAAYKIPASKTAVRGKACTLKI